MPDQYYGSACVFSTRIEDANPRCEYHGKKSTNLFPLPRMKGAEAVVPDGCVAQMRTYSSACSVATITTFPAGTRLTLVRVGDPTTTAIVEADQTPTIALALR